MYYLVGPRACLHTLLRLVTDPDDGAQLNLSQLRTQYIEFCADVGGASVRPLPDEGQVTYSNHRIAALLNKYRDHSSLTDITADIAETPPSSRRIAMARVTAAKH